MANLILIHDSTGKIIPAVPFDVKPGDRFQWVRGGQLGPILTALAPAKLASPVQPGVDPEWIIETKSV
jgi:hypothetical protein